MSKLGGKKDVRDTIFQALNADATLTSTLGAAVYAQSPPDDVGFPYVVVKAIKETARNTFGNRGKDVIIQCHTWHDERRSDLADNVDNRVIELLDDELFTVDNWTFITSDMVESVTVPDERWKHIVTQFSVRICE